MEAFKLPGRAVPRTPNGSSSGARYRTSRAPRPACALTSSARRSIAAVSAPTSGSSAGMPDFAVPFGCDATSSPLTPSLIASFIGGASFVIAASRRRSPRRGATRGPPSAPGTRRRRSLPLRTGARVGRSPTSSWIRRIALASAAADLRALDLGPDLQPQPLVAGRQERLQHRLERLTVAEEASGKDVGDGVRLAGRGLRPPPRRPSWMTAPAHVRRLDAHPGVAVLLGAGQREDEGRLPCPGDMVGAEVPRRSARSCAHHGAQRRQLGELLWSQKIASRPLSETQRSYSAPRSRGGLGDAGLIPDVVAVERPAGAPPFGRARTNVS